MAFVSKIHRQYSTWAFDKGKWHSLILETLYGHTEISTAPHGDIITPIPPPNFGIDCSYIETVASMTCDVNIHLACGRPSFYSANHSYEQNATIGEAAHPTGVVSIWTFLTGVVPLCAACNFEISDLSLPTMCIYSVAVAYFCC